MRRIFTEIQRQRKFRTQGSFKPTESFLKKYEVPKAQSHFQVGKGGHTDRHNFLDQKNMQPKY